MFLKIKLSKPKSFQLKNMKTIIKKLLLFIKKIIIVYLWILFLPISLTLKIILFFFRIIKKLILFVNQKINNF